MIESMDVYLKSLAIGVASISLGGSALMDSINEYAASQKLGQYEICIAKSYLQPEIDRSAFETSCKAKVNTRIDSALKPINEMLGSVTAMTL